MHYLLDTDWAIEYLHANSRFVDRIADLLPDGIGVSVFTFAHKKERRSYSASSCILNGGLVDRSVC